MLSIKNIAFTILFSTAFVAGGCGGGNVDTAQYEQGASVDDIVSDAETDSIAGLPAQNDSLKPTKQYTDHKFPTAEDAIAFMQQSGDWDKYREGILPQMTNECLRYASKLLNSPYKHFIVVDKDKMKVMLFDRYGRVMKQYGMAGPRNYGTKHKKGDSRTPEGYFSAEGVYDSTDWEFTDDDGVTHPGKPFGPRFIRVRNPITTQVGIHGTSSPGSIGRRTSHGCIRLHNNNIMELVKYVETGMPIIILPGEGDRAVNSAEGYDTGYFNTGVERLAGAQIYKPKPAPVSDSTTAVSDSATINSKTTPAEQQSANPSEPAKSEPEQPTEPQKQSE